MRSDWALLLVARGLRAFGFGFAAVLVGLHLEHAGLSPVLIGLTVGLGLASASLTGLGAVVFAVRFGRRATLAVTGLLMAVTGLDLALATQPSLLVLAGVTGMLGAGNLDLGPFAPIEQTAVAEVATPQQRNLAFGRYAWGPLQRGRRSGRWLRELRQPACLLPSLCGARRGDRRHPGIHQPASRIRRARACIRRPSATRDDACACRAGGVVRPRLVRRRLCRERGHQLLAARSLRSKPAGPRACVCGAGVPPIDLL